MRRAGCSTPPTITQIAEGGKTPAQVVLRWHIQRSDIVFHKSMTPSRMKENFELFDFEFDSQNMNAISALKRSEDVSTGPHPYVFNGFPNRPLSEPTRLQTQAWRGRWAYQVGSGTYLGSTFALVHLSAWRERSTNLSAR